jgi:hypothetical protein
MLLREIFFNAFKTPLFEGGNLSSHDAQGKPMAGWQGMPGVHHAEDLDLDVHDRTAVLDVLDQLMVDINSMFEQQYGRPVWPHEAFTGGSYLSGSSFHFFDRKISDEDFVKVKPKVGDIDTQAPVELDPYVKEFLTNMIGKQVGPAVFVGFKPGNNQYTSMWEVTLEKLPVKLQIDFEFGTYDSATNQPDEWYAYSHSSHWDDLSRGIKGVFHKYLNRAMPYAQASTKYVARVLKKSTKISPEPVTDSDFSFAVSGGQGGGLSLKYVPYIDPATGQQMIQNDVPVMQLLEPKDRHYEQSIGKHFATFFGHNPNKKEREAQDSFIGTVGLIANNYDDTQKTEVVNRFLDVCFEKGSQMITKGDPGSDRKAKFAAIDYILENLGLDDEPVGQLRQRAVQMSKEYEQDFHAKSVGKPITEAEAPALVQSKRKGITHLEKMKDIDFLDLLDEIKNDHDSFELQNIPMTVKVDGFGGRFGEDSSGRPYAETSRSGPKYEPGFYAYNLAKGADPETLKKSKQFDEWFEQMIEVAREVGEQIDLKDTKIHVESLYLPFAEEQEDGRLKFVGIKYNKLPDGITLALVPLFAEISSTGAQHPQSEEIIRRVKGIGQIGRSMFIDNSLTTKGNIDATGILPPVENLEVLRSMLLSKDTGINDRKKQVSAALQPVKDNFAKFIINHPDIVGKDMLGKDYEGIVLNTASGPVKITSQEQKQVISDKNAAIQNATVARKNAGQAVRNRTAVVTAGSFVGHKGHEQLVNLVLQKAEEVGGDPFVYISPTVGPDDPIPPEMKLATWQKLYPAHASMFHLWQPGGTPVKKIEKELVLPPTSPYKHVILMIGTDRFAGMKKWMDTLGKRMKDPRFPGSHNHVTFDTIETARGSEQGGTGISFTDCRNALKTKSEQQALKFWTSAFDVNKLGVDWIKKLMDTARQNMGIAPVVQQNTHQHNPVNTTEPASIKETNRIIREMRAHQFVNEGHASKVGTGGTKKIDKEKKAAMKNATTVPGLNMSTGSAYKNYRMGIALAGAPDYPTKMAADNWIGGDPLISSYTKEEFDMVKAAAKLVGAGTIQNWTGDRSKETADTNIASPINKPKKNRYGI